MDVLTVYLSVANFGHLMTIKKGLQLVLGTSWPKASIFGGKEKKKPVLNMQVMEDGME
jgi:hypothetical protein